MPVIDLSEHIKVKGYTILPLAASFIDAKALLVKMEPQHPRWDWLERIIFEKAEPVEYFGTIEEFWKNENKSLEQVANPKTSYILNLKRNSNNMLQFEADVQYYKKILENLNTEIDVALQIDGVKKVEFEFPNIVVNKYSLTSINNFIYSGKMISEADETSLQAGKCLVIHEVLQTNDFKIMLYDNSNAKINLASRIRNIIAQLKGKITINHSSTANTEMNWKSEDKFLTFAFKASPIIYDKKTKKYRISNIVVNIEYLNDNEDNFTKFETDKDFVVPFFNYLQNERL